jgi:hypothetical protein
VSRFLAPGSPERFFVSNAVLAPLIAAFVDRFPSFSIGFIPMLLVLLSADVALYVAMKAGWLRVPGQPRKTSQ